MPKADPGGDNGERGQNRDNTHGDETDPAVPLEEDASNKPPDREHHARDEGNNRPCLHQALVERLKISPIDTRLRWQRHHLVREASVARGSISHTRTVLGDAGSGVTVGLMADVFHLGLSRSDLQGATMAIVPGDPGRVERIANAIGPDNVPLASEREFTSRLAKLDGQPVVVCSTGIGGPSTSVAVEELAQLGITTFLRVGTTGAIQPNINVGDLIITTGAVRLDGASFHFAPAEYPAVANFEVTRVLVDAADAAGAAHHVGITASSDTFYPGQERYDTVAGQVATRFRGSLAEWQRLGVLNYEMESATLFTMCAANGWRAGCIAGAIVNRATQEAPVESAIEATEKLSVSVAVDAIRRLLAN